MIIIDGLDECIDRKMQQVVLNLAFKARDEWHLPFPFLVGSRPEPEICVAFADDTNTSIHFRINLAGDIKSEAESDIQIFLRDKLGRCRDSHPLRQYIPLTWPPETAIEALVRKLSGQFICELGSLISVEHGWQAVIHAEDFWHMDPGLQSLCSDSGYVRIFHASLHDYLFDCSRS